jgi:Predicted nucleic acid-binding protein, contains PIN domain
MVKALFDTNILIDYLNGIPAAREELDRYSEKAISIISWIEVMIGAPTHLANATRTFLDTFDRIDITAEVAERAVAIRGKFRIKLPDAIVWASADVNAMLLVTRNTKDFPEDQPIIRIPYRL